MPSFDLFQISQNEITDLDNSVSSMIGKLKKLKEQNPNLNNKEVFELYKNKNIEFLTHLLSVRAVRTDTFRLNAINYLLDNPFTFQSEYNRVIEDANNGKVDLDNIDDLNFPLNAKECRRTHVIDSIYSARNEYNKFLNELGITPYKATMIDLRSMKKQHNLRSGDVTLEVAKFLKMTEFERVMHITKLNKENFEQTVRNNYIETILGYVNHFKEMGYIDEYLQNQHKKFPTSLYLTMDDIDSFFTKENLKTLNLTKLAALYAFYANRYTKELERLETLNFCLVSGYSLDDFMEAEDPTKVIPEFLKAPLIKEQKYISDISERLLAINRAEVLAKQKFSTTDTSYSSTMDLSKMIPESELKEYMSTFQRKKREFYGMIQGTFNLKNHTVNQYQSKDASLLSLLSCIATYPSSVKNWGIVAKNDSINPNHNYQKVNFDLKGFNMPLRVHIPTDMLKDFAREYLESNYISVYEGTTDFKYMGLNLPVSIFLGQPERIIKSLHEKVDPIDDSKPLSDNDRLFAHLLYIADQDTDNIPTHLKSMVSEKKNGKRKQRLKFVKKYASLKTGEVLNERQYSNVKDR